MIFLAGLLILLFENLSLKVQVVSAPAPPVDLSAELAKRAPVDEVRLRKIIETSKSGSVAN